MPGTPSYGVFLLAALALLVVPAVGSAANGFTEQIASARWSIAFQCPDGSTAADGRMIVETDNFIEAGTTPTPIRPSGSGSRASVRTAPSAGASPGRRRRSSTRTSRT